MPTTYLLTPDAQSDLIEIRQYTLRQWGLAQSQKYVTELNKTIRLLAKTPSLGKFRPEVGMDVRSFPHVSHVIYYVVHEQHIIIFGVLHKGMVPIKHLIERGELLMT